MSIITNTAAPVVVSDQSERLLELTVEIQATYLETEAHVEAAIASAIKCGTALNEAKKIVGHGGWLDWLSTNFAHVKERYARNLMALAERHYGADLKKCTSVRQAFIALDIISDSAKPAQVFSENLVIIKYIVEDMQTHIKAMTPSEKAKAKQILSPIMRFLD